MKYLSFLQNPRFRNPLTSTIFDFIKIAIAGTAIIIVLAMFTGRMRYNWQWYRLPRYVIDRSSGGAKAGVLIQGLWVTLQISGLSLILASTVGLVTALLRLSGSIIANLIARIYLELIRNTPLLIQIFFIYFVISPILGLSRFLSAVLALSLFEGAYASEIIRGGILSIHRGQWESAHSLGFSSFHTYTLIIFPQVLRRILPPLTSQAVSLIKDSALVSTIAVYDLTMRGSVVVAETFLTFEIWFAVAVIYLAVTSVLSMGTHMLEKRLLEAQ